MTDNPFARLKIDPVAGMEIMNNLGASQMDLFDNVRFSKIHDIIKYFQDKEESRFIINKVSGKGGDRVEKVWGYVQLQREYETNQAKIEKLRDEMPEELRELSDELTSKGVSLEKEISLYE